MLTAALTVLAVGSMASAIVYSENFDSGYTDGTSLLDYPGWFGDTSDPGVKDPVVRAGVGVAGTMGLEQHSRAFTWTAHPFDWSDPTVTSVVIGIDFESTWMNYDAGTDTWSWQGNKPFDDDYIGWTVLNDSTGSGDTFGVQLEGYEARLDWPYGASGSQISPVSVHWALPSAGELAVKPETFYRVRVEYAKGTDTSASVNVSVMELDANGDPVALIASGSVADTSLLPSKAPQPALFTGPMWVKAKNYNASAGNADNLYLEIIPEPATLLLSLGSLVLLIGRRRVK